MKASFTSIAATAAVLLGSTAALAAPTVPTQPASGPIPVPSTGNSGLVLSIWDTTQPVSLTAYLGLSALDVQISEMTPDAGLSLDFGTIAGLQSTFGANNANLVYSIVGIRGSGAATNTIVETTAALGSSFTANTGNITGVSTIASGFFGSVNISCQTTNPCSTATGSPYAGDEVAWGAQYSGQLPVDASASLGTALGFYALQPLNRSAQAQGSVTAYANASGFGQWLLGTDGHLTYSIDGGTTPTVPLPAAVWLLLSGLTGLGVVGRRRRAAAALA
jgi:hypothetical protein